MGKWIKCSERMPDNEQDVFYYFRWVGVWAGKYKRPNTFYSDSGFLTGDVTHWMPRMSDDLLPEPPQ